MEGFIGGCMDYLMNVHICSWMDVFLGECVDSFLGLVHEWADPLPGLIHEWDDPP